MVFFREIYDQFISALRSTYLRNGIDIIGYKVAPAPLVKIAGTFAAASSADLYS